MRPELAFCTIVARNYVPFAAALAESLQAFHPSLPRYVLVADNLDPASMDAGSVYRRVTLNELETPQLMEFLFRYERQQVLVAKKPSLIRHLLERGYQSVVFLDADMLVLDDLSPLLDRVAQHSLTLTPHFHAVSLEPGRFRQEHQLLLAGIHNAGLIGVSNRREAIGFLEWWETRLHEHCRSDVRRGLHYDQRWLDMAPAYVSDLCVYREGDCNLGYWSLSGCEVYSSDDGRRLSIAGKPCRVFHFSGFDPQAPQAISRFAHGLDVTQQRSIAPLFEHYAQTLRRLGLDVALPTPWRWDTFSNRVRIPASVRDVFAGLRNAGTFVDPFDASDPSGFYAWLRQPIDPEGPGATLPIPHLWQALYERHPDLRARFPDLAGTHRDTFVEWMLRNGMKRFDLPPEFGPVAPEAAGGVRERE